jgi:hypothetical protein
MRKSGSPVRFWRALSAVALAVGLCGPVAGCAADPYAGLVPVAAGADPGLRALLRRARAGDRQAQLELGERYEQGRGVPADRARACAIYLVPPPPPRTYTWVLTPSARSEGDYVWDPAEDAPRDALAARAARCRLAR